MQLHLHAPDTAKWIDLAIGLVGPCRVLCEWSGSDDPRGEIVADAIGGDYIAVASVERRSLLILGDIPAAYSVLAAECRDAGEKRNAVAIFKWLGAESGAVLPPLIELNSAMPLQTAEMTFVPDEYLVMDSASVSGESLRFRMTPGPADIAYFELEIPGAGAFGLILVCPKGRKK